jgi:hypothetical protein
MDSTNEEDAYRGNEEGAMLASAFDDSSSSEESDDDVAGAAPLEKITRAPSPIARALQGFPRPEDDDDENDVKEEKEKKELKSILVASPLVEDEFQFTDIKAAPRDADAANDHIDAELAYLLSQTRGRSSRVWIKKSSPVQVKHSTPPEKRISGSPSVNQSRKAIRSLISTVQNGSKCGCLKCWSSKTKENSNSSRLKAYLVSEVDDDASSKLDIEASSDILLPTTNEPTAFNEPYSTNELSSTNEPSSINEPSHLILKSDSTADTVGTIRLNEISVSTPARVSMLISTPVVPRVTNANFIYERVKLMVLSAFKSNSSGKVDKSGSMRPATETTSASNPSVSSAAQVEQETSDVLEVENIYDF